MTSSLPRKCSTPELHGHCCPYLNNTPKNLERVGGIEPPCSAWKADVLPLNYTRQHLISAPASIKWWRGKDSNLRRLSRQIYSLLPLAAREPLPQVTEPRRDIHYAAKSQEFSCKEPEFSFSVPARIVTKPTPTLFPGLLYVCLIFP